MQINSVSLPDGYSLKSSISFKKGKFALAANLIVLVGFIVGIALAILLFDYDTSASGFLSDLSLDLLLFVACLFGFILINPIITIICYKLFGGGKTSLHIGLIIDIKCEKAITRNAYLFSQLISGLIPLLILSILGIFFWTNYILAALIVLSSNLIACTPAYLSLLKHDKTALVHFHQGLLNIFTSDVAAQ